MNSLQTHVETTNINYRIETKTSKSEREKLYHALFESLPSTFDTRCDGNDSNWSNYER